MNNFQKNVFDTLLSGEDVYFKPTKITIDNYAEKAPELVAYMQSVAQKKDETFPSFGNIRVMYVEQVDKWAIDVDYTTSDPFYTFSSDKVFAELVQDVVNKFCNEPFDLNVTVRPLPEEDPDGDRALAILLGFNSEAEAQEWDKKRVA